MNEDGGSHIMREFLENEWTVWAAAQLCEVVLFETRVEEKHGVSQMFDP